MRTAEAIPTLYKGLSFRSRTEARWAAFFDRLHVTWEYEPRGYTAGGGAYLPDFYLPDLHCWLEAKGGRPGGHEKQKLIQLAKHTGSAGYIQQGAPGDAWGMLVATREGFPHNLTWWSAHPAQLADGRIGFAVECQEEADPVLMAGAHELPVMALLPGIDLALTAEVFDAIQIARSTKWVETPGPQTSRARGLAALAGSATEETMIEDKYKNAGLNEASNQIKYTGFDQSLGQNLRQKHAEAPPADAEALGAAAESPGTGTMTPEEFLATFTHEAGLLIDTVGHKNHDYTAGSRNAFYNFDLVEHLTHGKITAEMGIFVRLCDKFSRAAGLLFPEAQNHVRDEPLEDTLHDLAAYALIAVCRRRARRGQ